MNDSDNKNTYAHTALAALSEMCGCDASAAIKDHVETHWASDPISLGAYSAALPGSTDWRAVLARPVADRLYFAGEATYNAQYNGSYAGAYSSGIVASLEILDSLRAQATVPPK